MVETKDKEPPSILLNYKKGDLIVKEGDYGVSIYKVVSGRVKVSKESPDIEITLSVLGQGEVFGEMAFLNKGKEVRSASVRALEDCALEVWHPASLLEEYGAMSPVMKYVIGHTLNRFLRMNVLYANLLAKKKQEKVKVSHKARSDRKQRRKTIERQCVYRPMDPSAGAKLQGRVTDISMIGMGIDVSSKNIGFFSHDPGKEFHVVTSLPSGLGLEMACQMKSIRNKEDMPGRMRLGLEITSLLGESAKRLGFFMTT